MTAICALVGLCHFYPRVDAIFEQPRCGWKSAVSRNQRCSRLGSEVRMEINYSHLESYQLILLIPQTQQGK
jgi:hypothetical protein